MVQIVHLVCENVILDGGKHWKWVNVLQNQLENSLGIQPLIAVSYCREHVLAARRDEGQLYL